MYTQKNYQVMNTNNWEKDKIMKLLMKNERKQKIINNNINSINKKIKKIKNNISRLNYFYKLSYKKWYYTKYFKNIHDLVDFRFDIELKIYNYDLKLKLYNFEIIKLTNNFTKLVNDYVYLIILLNKIY